MVTNRYHLAVYIPTPIASNINRNNRSNNCEVISTRGYIRRRIQDDLLDREQILLF